MARGQSDRLLVGPLADRGGHEVQSVYPSLFADPATGTSYLMYGRVSADPATTGSTSTGSNGTAIASATATSTPRTSSAGARSPAESTQVSVERRPDRSPDGTPYVAFNCGAAACDGDEVLYQDVQVSRRTRAGRSRSAAPSARRAAPVSWSSTRCSWTPGARSSSRPRCPSRPVTPMPVPAARSSWSRARGACGCSSTPRTPGTFWADNVYLIPQEGCEAHAIPRADAGASATLVRVPGWRNLCAGAPLKPSGPFPNAT